LFQKNAKNLFGTFFGRKKRADDSVGSPESIELVKRRKRVAATDPADFIGGFFIWVFGRKLNLLFLNSNSFSL
jgi:hypothetical protein